MNLTGIFLQCLVRRILATCRCAMGRVIEVLQGNREQLRTDCDY